MIRAYLVLAFVLAAAGFMGTVDQQSSEVSRQAAVEAPRPIFESQAELVSMHMPCYDIRQPAYYNEPVTARNTRCTKADRSDK